MSNKKFGFISKIVKTEYHEAQKDYRSDGLKNNRIVPVKVTNVIRGRYKKTEKYRKTFHFMFMLVFHNF